MRILAVGDSYMPSTYFRAAFATLEHAHEVRYAESDETSRFEPSTPSELGLSEYLGSPHSLARMVGDAEVLVVQGAPVSREVIENAPSLVLVGCARGGPVNLDVSALDDRGITLVTTPGKNSEAVADLTLAFLVMLARGVTGAIDFLERGEQIEGNFAGAQFMGSDLRGHTLGLVGYGQVGRRVALRARSFGMRVIVYDPAVTSSDDQQVASLEELLGQADFVSLHARAPAGGAKLIDAEAIAQMKPGACLLNTAREALIDEDALDDALASGRIAGAALDVFELPPAGEPLRFLRHRNVVVTPHIGGATRESLQQGADMIAAEIVRFAASEPLVNVVGGRRT
jgi:D-3-phosphoglycerate dehydrogenase